MAYAAQIAQGLLGLAGLMFLAWLLSMDRKRFPWRVAIWGVLLQIGFAALILKTPPGHAVFEFARVLIAKLLSFTDAGARFLWGWAYETTPWGQYAVFDARSGLFSGPGIIFALHVLMTIVFFASLMGILYHIGVMQWIVAAIAKGMRRALRTSGAETLAVSANIFVGQTEAPLVVRPYVERMTNSELMAVMAGGFATVAGGVMAAYVRFGIDAGHLLAASVMSAPAALVFAKVLLPETGQPETAGEVKVQFEKTTSNVIDAAASGATDGLRLALNVGAMLVAFIALIALVDWGLGLVDQGIVRSGIAAQPLGLSLQRILGWLFYPFAILIGIPPQDAVEVGSLLGTKIAINEFVAFGNLATLRQSIDPRSFDIATYALCGFANFGSIAIQIGGISAVAPGRRTDLARLGLRAMIAGAFASWQTAAIAGLLIQPEASAERLAIYRAQLPERARDFQAELDDNHRIAQDYPNSEAARLARLRLTALRVEFLEYLREVTLAVRDLTPDGAQRMLLERLVAASPQDEATLRARFESDPDSLCAQAIPELAAARDVKAAAWAHARTILLQAVTERCLREPRHQYFLEQERSGHWALLAREFLPESPQTADMDPDQIREQLRRRSIPARVAQMAVLRSLAREGRQEELRREADRILDELREDLQLLPGAAPGGS